MNDKIIINNLRLRGILGINPEERIHKQDIIISLELYTDIKPAAHSDCVEDAVNYKSVTKQIIRHIEQSSDRLIEKLVSDIARFVLADYKKVHRVVISVDKPGALRFTDSVGIRIDRTRADYE